MSEFKIDGRMKVKKLKELFKNEYGGTLRIYKGKSLADDNDTLASIRSEDGVKGGGLVCRASRTVGRFEKEMKEVFGIKVQVATPDDSILVLDGITLSKVKDIKKKASKEDMEELIAYKRSAAKDSADGKSEESAESAGSKHVCIDVTAQCHVLRMCKVKEESVSKLEEMDEDTFKQTIFDQLGERDSDFFEEALYDWYFLRYDDLDQSFRMEVSVDGDEVYSSSDPWSNDWQVKLPYCEDEDEDQMAFLQSLKSDDFELEEFFQYVLEEAKECHAVYQIARPVKYLTGEYRPDEEPTFAGYRWVKQVTFSFEFDIPADEDFDIGSLTQFECPSDMVDFTIDAEGGRVIDYMAYKDQLLSGELTYEDSNELTVEPPMVYMASGTGCLTPIRCCKYKC